MAETPAPFGRAQEPRLRGSFTGDETEAMASGPRSEPKPALRLAASSPDTAPPGRPDRAPVKKQKRRKAAKRKARSTPPVSQPEQAGAQATRRAIKAPIVRGFLIILITFGGFGAWAMTAELSQAVIASGTLTVSGKSKEVQHLEGGIIREILVKDGDQVSTGDPLVRLDGTRQKASHSITQGRYDAARAAAARLMAERDERETIVFPNDLLVRRTDPDTAQTLKTQEQTFEVRKRAQEGKVSLIRERIGQLEAEIKGLEAQAASRARQLTLLKDELAGLKELFEKGFAPATRIRSLEREMARLEGDRASDLAAIAKSRQAISEAELQITQEQTAFREQVVNELREQERQIFDLTNELGATTDTLRRTVVAAPTSGTVVGMSVHTVGAVIDPGQVLMEIVPEDDLLVIEARIRPQDIDSVTVGLDADVQLAALSQRDVGKLSGAVSYVSADSMADSRTGQPYFIAHVEIDQETVEIGDIKLQPGMPADIFINTGARTPFAYLTSPLTDSLSRAWREQ